MTLLLITIIYNMPISHTIHTQNLNHLAKYYVRLFPVLETDGWPFSLNSIPSKHTKDGKEKDLVH